MVDPTLLGTVQDVRGVTISVHLDSDTLPGLIFVNGQAYRVGQVGSFIRIPLGYVDLFGIVSQVGAGSVPERIAEEEPHGHRWMTIELIGEGRRGGEFQRGVSQHPTIGDSVHLVTEDELERIYGRPNEPQFVRIGTLAGAEAIPALIDVNKLVTRHCAVVGSTGAGKSTTVAAFLHALSTMDRYPSARMLVLDIHGEYAAASQDFATIFRLNPDTKRSEQPFYLPYWAMTFDELLPITLGRLEDADRAQVLQMIMGMKQASLGATPRSGVTEDSVTVDSPVPFSIHQLWFDLHGEVASTHTTAPGGVQSRQTWALELDANGNPVEPGDAENVVPPIFRGLKNVANDPDKVYTSNSSLQSRRAIDSLASKLRDPRFDFLLNPGPWRPETNGQPQEDLDTLLSAWVGGDKPITILDLSGIPPSIQNELVGVLLRIIYDALFWARDLAEGGRERPLLIVMEEAHAYLSEGGSAEASVRRIVKEGRKYGIGAMIVSQRPSEIEPGILAQCGTIIAMRLGNELDRGQISSTAPDNLANILSILPVLRTGEAIIMGESVHLPMRALIDRPPFNRRPSSSDPLIYERDYPGGWNNPKLEDEDYSEVVHVWRNQQPRSPRIVDDQDEIEEEP